MDEGGGEAVMRRAMTRKLLRAVERSIARAVLAYVLQSDSNHVLAVSLRNVQELVRTASMASIET